MQDHLEAIFMDPSLPWTWQDNTSGFSSWEFQFLANKEKIKESPQFVHDILNPQTGHASQTFEMIKPIFYFFEKETGIPVKELTRIKANLLTPDGSDETMFHPPHIDQPYEESLSMVYYVNEADGPTRIFDKNVGANPYGKPDHLGPQDDMKELIANVPKKGSAILFPSNQFHASATPTVVPRRIVINMVWMPAWNFWQTYLKK
jgi:hypothetical protein